jgi:subtilisin-like proprotein convertase family protein
MKQLQFVLAAVVCAAAAADAVAADGITIEETVGAKGSAATAQALPQTPIRVRGNIVKPVPAGVSEVDYYSFQGHAGDRVYAATMTAQSAYFPDSVLDLLNTDGTSVIETDADDGSFATLASSIAGAVLPQDGTYYLRVSEFSTIGVMEPYWLYLDVRSGNPSAETETNDTFPGQVIPTSRWVSGTAAIPDRDFFNFTLNAGDTVWASLDQDPERDGSGIDAFLQFVLAGGNNVTADGAQAAPLSESLFATVSSAGTYSLQVGAVTGASSYNLSVVVFPAVRSNERAFVSSDVPKPIGAAIMATDFAVTVPTALRARKVRVAVTGNHTNFNNADISLVSPAGDEVMLSRGISAGPTSFDLVFDDDAALPVDASSTALAGVEVAPWQFSRLAWMRGVNAQGTWRLRVRQTTATSSGVINAWTLIVEEDVAPACTLPATIYSTDFEADGGGFSHSGTLDEWEWGAPTAAPITSAASGTKCWKTDLDNTYDNLANEELFSPVIQLPTAGGVIRLEWSMKYHVELTRWDHVYVEVREQGGAALVKRVWEYNGPTLQTPAATGTTIDQPAGWGRHRADISEFAGKNVQVVFHLDSDGSIVFGGLAVDDVSIVDCAEPASLAGRAYRDDDVDGVSDATEPGVAGQGVTLSGLNDLGALQSYQTTTDATGAFSFTGLRPSGLGGYHILFSPDPQYTMSASTPGTLGGVAGFADVTSIQVTSGATGTGYAFGLEELASTGAGGGDGDLCATSASFFVDWKKHAAGTHAVDKFSVSGAVNPDDMPADLTGAHVYLRVNGNPLGDGALTKRGTFTVVGVPTLKFKLSARTGVFSLTCSALDLSDAQNVFGIVDSDVAAGTTLPAVIEVEIQNANLETARWAGRLAFAYGSTTGRSAAGRYSSRKQSNLTGCFKLTKCVVTQQKNGAHKFVLGGALEPAGGGAINLTGPVEVTIGTKTFVVPTGALVKRGAGASAVFTLKRGVVPELASFVLNNATKSFTMTTAALTPTGIPVAGAAASTRERLFVRLGVESATGLLPFATRVRIQRTRPTSPLWSQ